jgi:hypothetical protein
VKGMAVDLTATHSAEVRVQVSRVPSDPRQVK